MSAKLPSLPLKVLFRIVHHLSHRSFVSLTQTSALLRRTLVRRVHLLDLPTELLVKIALDLPYSSAVDFARTCSALRDIALRSAWTDLNMSLQQRPYANTYQPNSTSASRAWILRLTRLAPDVRPDLPVEGRSLLETHLTGIYLENLVKLILRDRGWRQRTIRSIQYNLDRVIPREFINLLNHVSPFVRSIELVGPDCPFTYNDLDDPEKYFHLEDAIARIHKPFPRLYHVQFPIGHAWELRVRRMLALAPNLRSLILTPNTPWSGGWGDVSVFTPASKPTTWPAAPNLQRLEIEQVGPALIPMVLSLVKGAEDVMRYLAIRDPEEAWHPAEDDELVDRLCHLRRLEYLAVPEACLAGIQKGGFSNLRQLSIETAVGSEFPTYPSFPTFPSIQRIFCHRPTHGHDLIPVSLYGGQWLSLPQPIFGINSFFLRAILDMPALELIQYPTANNGEFTTHNWEYWGSPACFSASDEGLLIRTYRPRIPHPDDPEETFIHCRQYTSYRLHPTEHYTYRSDSTWTEEVDYRGYSVPANYLSWIYTQAGETSAWVRPGRNLELPDIVWTELRKWYAAVKRKEARRLAEDAILQEAEEKRRRKAKLKEDVKAFKPMMGRLAAKVVGKWKKLV